MRKVVRADFLSWMIVCLCLLTSQSKAEDLNQALATLQTAVGDLTTRINGSAGSSSELRAGAAGLQQKTNDLEDLLSTSTSTVSPEYVLTLSTNARTLRNALNTDTQMSKAAIADVSADIGIKLANTRAAMNLTSGGGLNVSVQVTTKKGADLKDGYFVSANPIRYQASAPMFPFGNPSSPAKRELAPGRYELTAQMTGRPASKQTFDIGANGERQMTLILLVE